MTLTPDDLPGDGAQQVICACMAELFKIVVNHGSELVGVCSGCGSTAQRWPIAPWASLPGERMVGPGRDTVTMGGTGAPLTVTDDGVIIGGGGGGYSAGAAWGTITGKVPQPGEDEIRQALEKPPALPEFSPEVANVYLSGGPYDGQVTWVMPGATEFGVAGLQGKYHLDAEGAEREGRAVFGYIPAF